MAAALDRDAAAPREFEVVFDEDEWVSTIAESLSRSELALRARARNPVVRTMDDPEAADGPGAPAAHGEHPPGGPRGRPAPSSSDLQRRRDRKPAPAQLSCR